MRITVTVMLIWLCALLPAGRALAQGGGVAASASPRGIWVYLGATLAKDAPYVVSREGDGGFAERARVTAPASRDELARRVAQFSPMFPGLPQISAEEVDRMWKHLGENKDVSKFIPVNLPVAHLAFGTAYLDTEVTPGAHRYRVEGGPRSRAAESRSVSFPATQEPAAPLDAEWHFDGARLNVSWRLVSAEGVGGLIVARRSALRGAFAPYKGVAGFSREGDSARVVLSDGSVDPGTVYEYQVTLVDGFANPGVSSEVVRVNTFPEHAIPIVSKMRAEQTGEPYRVKLSWSLAGEGYVRAIAIERSATFDGDYETVASLPPQAREYVDVVPASGENMFYRLVLSGVDGVSYPSVAVAGMARMGDKPLRPQNVTAEPTDDGIRVSWEGLGPHVIGYHVYRSMGPNDDWGQISNLVGTDGTSASFVDTSSTLSGRVPYYYAVRAVSDDYTLSEPSESAVASPAAQYTLATPLNLRSVIDGARVHLFWDDLSEREPTLAGYDVFRRRDGSGEFERVNEGGYAPRNNRWVDSTAVGGRYEYAVQAVDLRGVHSAMSAGHSAVVRVETALPVPGGTRVSVVLGGVHVAWSPIESEVATGYRLYRSEPGAKPALIATLSANEVEFVDTSVRRGRVYLYHVSVLASDGEEGAAGTTVSIRY